VTLHAVLIGIDSYADGSIPALRFAGADARAFGTLLTDSALGADVTVHTLLDGDATRVNVLQLVGVEVAQQVKPEDIFLFFFAGHGSPEIYPGLDKLSRFLVCADTRAESLLPGAIDVKSDLARVAARIQARLVLFIIDACFSGYGGGRGICGPQLAEQRRRHRPSGRLADLSLGSGSIFLTACGNDEVAAESDALGHGIFTYYILQQLNGSGAPSTIGLPTLYDLVYRQVHGYTAGRQNPMLWGNVKGASLPRLGGK
jgi:uncharacterized caspase-like protein